MEVAPTGPLRAAARTIPTAADADLPKIISAYNHSPTLVRLVPCSDPPKKGARMPVNPEVLKSFLDAFNRHDVDAIMDFFVEDCEFDTPRGPAPFGLQLRGKEAVRRGIAARFEGIPDVSYEDDVHWSCGNNGVSQWTIRGTTSDGNKIEVRGCDLLEFEGDKLRRKDSFWKIVE
jgi:ketosteroid isomerase-like protein